MFLRRSARAAFFSLSTRSAAFYSYLKWDVIASCRLWWCYIPPLGTKPEEQAVLEGYFDLDGATGNDALENRKRLLAVQAALEISKAAVSATTANAGIRSQMDLRNVSQEVATLADAIQDALEAD